MRLTTITIIVNRKTDIEFVKTSLVNSEIEFPIYFFEYESHFQIEFISDYEEWELDTRILDFFPDCEFVKELENGRKEIRIQITRQQDDYPYYEPSINETKYLVRKSTKPAEKFNPKVKVLFKEEERNYYINIIGGQTPLTGKKGYLLLTNFLTQNSDKNPDFFKETLYESKEEAFRFGYYKMQELVNKDFSKFIEVKKKEATDLHKIPRKIVRDFINSCNNSDIAGLCKNLDSNFVFLRSIQWKIQEEIEGIANFKNYIISQEQDLCGKNFKIRSHWNIKLPKIEIRVKYYPTLTQNNSSLKYRNFTFKITSNKITSIEYDNQYGT